MDQRSRRNFTDEFKREALRIFQSARHGRAMDNKSKQAIHWTRQSCHSFRNNEVRPQLHALAYNLSNVLRTPALPQEVEHWSPTTLQTKLIKIGAKVVRHGRRVTFQLAAVAIPRHLYVENLRRIDELRLGPAAAMTGFDSEAIGLPDRGATHRECRSVPSMHERFDLPAVHQPNRPHKPRRSSCKVPTEPRLESYSTAECATVFGQLEMLSGKSRIKTTVWSSSALRAWSRSTVFWRLPTNRV